MVDQPIYTGPGTAPVGIDPGMVQGNIAGFASFPGQVLDMPGFLIRALTKIVPTIDMFGAEITNSKPLGQEFAAQVEKAIPQDYFTKAVENVILGGQRERIAEQIGEGPFLAGRITSGIGLPLALAMKAPKIFKTFDTFTDIATATPSAQIMQGANTLPQIIGKGAQIGGMSSIAPAIDFGYRAETNTADPMAAALTLAGGTALGAGLPAVIGASSAIPQIGKGIKGALDNLVQGTSQMVKQSDNMKVMKQISEASYQREQMQSFAKAQEAEVAKIYEPEPAPVVKNPTIERTFAKGVPSYEEVPNITKMQEEDLIRLANDEANLAEGFQLKIAKQEEELNTLTSYIEEAKAKPVEILDDEVFKLQKGPKTQREVVDELRATRAEEIKTEKAKIKEEIDTAMSRQMTLKEKEKNLAKLIKEKTPEELQKDFGNPIETVQSTVQKDLEKNEIGIGKLQKQLDKINSKLDKTIPVRKVEVEQRMVAIKEEQEKLRQELIQQKEIEKQKLVQELESEADTVFNRYEGEKAKQQKKLAKIQKLRELVKGAAPEPKLPAVIEKPAEVTPAPELKLRFISGRQGIKEYNPETGLPVPIRNVDSITEKEMPTVTEKGDIILPEPISTSEKWIKSYGSTPILKPAKHKSEFTTLRSKVLRTNKQLGGKLISHSQNQRIYKQGLIEKLKDLKSAVVKYQNDDTVMAVLGEVTSGRASKDLLPKDLREALIQSQTTFGSVYDVLKKAGYDLPKKLDLYFPFRVKDFEKLLEIGGEDARLVQEQLNQAGKASVNDLSEEQKTLLQGKLEKSRAQRKYTPEKMAAYKSMPEALESHLNEVSTAYADAMLFGDKMQRPRGELYADLILNTPGITPEQAPQLYNLIGRYFEGKDFIASPAFKAVRSAISLFLLTGYKTSLAQLSAVLNNTSKLGLFEAIEGVGQVYTMLTGGKSIAKKLGVADMPQDLNDFGIESIDQLMTFIKNQRATPLEKIGKTAKVGSFKLLQIADLVEKEMTLGASYGWLKRHVGKKDFSVFKDKYQGVFTPKEFQQLEKELIRLRDPKNKEGMSPLVFKAIDTLAGERIPVGDLDKTGGALGGEGSRLFHGLQTYAYKMADDVYDNTIQLTREAIRDKDPQKALFAFRYAMGFATVLVPGLTFWNHLRGGDTLEKSVESTIDPNELVATGIRTTTPIGSRVADLAASTANSTLGTQVGGQLLNFGIPGSSTSLKVLGDTAKAAIQGENFLDPEFNPSSKRLPPAIINEAIYNLSDKKRSDEAAKLDRQSKTLAKERLKKDIKYIADHDIPVGSVDEIQSKKFKKQLSKSKTVRSNLKNYQTTDPLEAKRIEIMNKAFPEAEAAFRARIEDDLRSGKINRDTYEKALKKSNGIIIRMLEDKLGRGQL